MIRPHPVSLLLAALALPVIAQESVPPTVASAPIFVLKTSRTDFATFVATKMSTQELAIEIPELPAGGHFVVTLGADRKLALTTATGDVGVLRMVGDPGALMDAFATEIEGAKTVLQGSMTVALQAQGMKPKDVAAFVKSVLEFPKQVARMTLEVTGDPKARPEDGLVIALALEPKAGSAFTGFVEALEPCPQGAPSPASPGALFEMRGSFAPASLAKVLAPFRNWTVNLTNQGEEQRAKAQALYAKWLEVYDGGVGIAIGEGFRGRMLIGATDAAKLQQLVASEEYRAMMEGQQMANRDVEMVVTPDALEHRGVKALKMEVSGYEPNPMMPEGSMTTYAGAAGKYLFVVFGGQESAAKATIDAISDQKVGRAPLPGGALVDSTIDLPAMFAMVGRPPAKDMPQKLSLSVGKNGKALALHALVR
jgi:hypothetical protein